MSDDGPSVTVSLPDRLVADIDDLVARSVVTSRQEALEYGARLVVEEFDPGSDHDAVDARPRDDVRERLERKRTA